MKGKLHRVGKLLVLSLVSAGLLMPVQAKAAEYKCEATLPVEVREEGSDIPQGTEYTVRIKALDDAPMPEKDSVTMTGEGKAELGPITYTVPEDYCYEVWQEADDRDHFTFDDTVYTVTVRVTNTQEGGLEAQIWAIREGEEAFQTLVPRGGRRRGRGYGSAGNGCTKAPDTGSAHPDPHSGPPGRRDQPPDRG